MDKTKMKKVETFASIFGEDHSEVPSEKQDGTTSLKLDDLIPFRNHPFKLYEGDRFNDMVESIKNYGVIVPIVVRKVDDKYEILSGHNRVNAAKEAGLTEVPTVIKEGLAIPHIIIDGKNIFDILVVRCKNGINFKLENKIVNTVFVLAGSQDERNFHLKALMSIAQIVSEENFENKWKAAKNINELKNIILLSNRKRG